MGDAVVVTDDSGGAEEVAEAVADTAEAVAEAVADAVEDIVDAVDDAGGNGGHTDADVDRWVENERRLNDLGSQLDDVRTRVYQTPTADEVRAIVAEVAAPVAATVAEEVAEGVVDEGDIVASDEDAAVTIVTPDVGETPRKSSFWRNLW